MAAAQELTREWKEIAADPRFAGLPVETRQRLRKNWLQKFSQTPEFMAETPEKRQAFVDGFLAKDTSMVQGAGVSGAPVAPLVTPQVQPFTIPAGLSGIDPLSGKAPSPIPERQPYIVATPESSFLGPLAGKVLGGIGRGLNIAAGAIPAALVGLERAGAAAVEGVTGQELPPGGFERLYVQPEAQGSGLVDVAESAGANLLSALSLPTVVAQSAVNAFRRGVLEGKPEEAVTEITPIIDFLKSRSPEERQAVLEKVLDIAGKTEGQKLVAMLVADPLNVFGGAEAVSAAKRAGVGLKTAGKQAAQKLSEAQSLAQSGRIEEALSMLERDFPLRKPAPVEPPVAVREAPSVPISTELPASRVLPARPVEDVFQGVPPVERPPAEPLRAESQLVEPPIREHVYISPSGKKTAVEYKIVEMADLTPSHDAAFRPNPKYPKGVQPRSYELDEFAQTEVNRMAQEIKPEKLVVETTEGTVGPPIVNRDGIVISGNQRTMALSKAYHGGRGTSYKNYLKQRAEQFGATPEEVAKMERPVLVRVIEAEGENLKKLAQETNVVETKTLSGVDKAVLMARDIPRHLLDDLREVAPEISLREFLDTPSGMRWAGEIASSTIPRTERHVYFTPAGTLTEEGKRLLERALVAKVIPSADLLSDIPPSIFAKLTKAAPALASLTGTEASISEHLADALKVLREARSMGKTAEELVGSSTLFARDASKAADLLAVMLEKSSMRDFAERMRRYVSIVKEETAGAQALFDEAVPKVEEVFSGELSAALKEPRRVSPEPLVLPGEESVPAPTPPSPPAAGKIPRRTRLEAQLEKTAVARQAVRTPLEAVAELSEERFAGAKVGVGELKKEVKTYLDSVIPSKDRQDSVIGAAYRKYTRSLSTASTPRAINELRDKIGRFVDSQLRKEKANEIFTLSKKALDSPGIAEADKEAVRDFMTHYRQTKPRDKWNWETAKKEILDANETGLIPTTLYEAPLSSQRMIKEKLEQVIAKAKENTAFRELQIKNEAMRVKAALKNKVVPVVLSDVNTENAIKNIAAKAKNFINRHDRAASTTDVVFDIFDGSPGTYDGPLSREIKDPIFAALNDSSQLTARAESVAEGIVFGIPSEGRRKLHRRLLVEQKNGIYSYVRDSNLTLAEAQKALNLPDEDFRFLWENGYLPYEKLNAALPLTPEETRAAGSFRVLYDSHHRAFNATLKRELGEVSGYIPNFYPLDNARHVKTSLEQVQSSIQRRGFFRANTEKNFIKARTEIGQKGRVEKILKTADGAELDMNVRYNPGEVAVEPEVQEVYKDYARRVNKFNALFPEKRRLNALLEDPEFVKMVGDEGAAYLKEFGETVILDRPLATGIETLEALGRNFSVARLALNAGTIFVQFPSSMATIAITGPEPLFQAATKWIREPSFRDFLLKNSAELRNRIGGGEVGLTDVFHPTAEAKVARAVAIGQASAMRPLQWADSTSAAFSMGAGYLDELAKAGLTHETATTPQRLAALNKGERVMRAVQGSTDVAKMPQMISRNKEFLGRINRLSFQFQTFPIQVIWNTLRHDLLRAGIYHKNPKAFTRAAQALFIIASGEALVRHGLDKLIDPAMPEEERVKIWRRALQNIGSSVPVFGKLLDLQYEPKAIPAVEPVISAGQSVAKLAKGEEKAQNAMRLIRALSEGIGVPVRPLEKDVRMAAGGLRILTDEEGIEKERLERERKLREKQRRKAMKERKEENREARQ